MATTKARRSALKLPNLEKEANLPAELLAIGLALAPRENDTLEEEGWDGRDRGAPPKQTNSCLRHLHGCLCLSLDR